MSSENQTTRCLYCSLACPVSVKQRARGIVEPEYVNSTDAPGPGGLCYRGHYVAALMAHPKRVVESRSKTVFGTSGGAYELILSEAAGALQNAAKDNKLGVLLSGNLPIQEISAAVRFFQEALPALHLSIYIPPSDEAMFEGLAHSRAALTDRSAIGGAQSILAIGDVLGTHPMLARDLLGFKESSRRAQLISLDALKGRTMRFANSALSVNAGTETKAIMALALMAGADLENLCEDVPKIDDLLNACGLDRSVAEKSLEALKQDSNSVILLTMPQGRSRQNEILTGAAGELAVATGSKILPLYCYGGSAGAFALSRSLNLSDATAWFDAAVNGEFSTIFVVGVDPLGVLPADYASQVFEKVNKLIVASSMPSATTERADIVLPMAFWFEMDGEVIDYKGQSIPLNKLGEPCGAAQTLVGLLNTLAQKAGLDSVSKTNVEFGMPLAKMPLDEKYTLESFSTTGAQEDTFIVLSRTENLDLYDGWVSRQLDWVLTIEPGPVVMINPEDAVRLKLQDKNLVSLSSDGNSVKMRVRINDAVPSQTVAVSGTIPDTSDLFDWYWDNGIIEIRPGRAQLSVLARENK